jgi:hypothetical protein
MIETPLPRAWRGISFPLIGTRGTPPRLNLIGFSGKTRKVSPF